MRVLAGLVLVAAMLSGCSSPADDGLGSGEADDLSADRAGYREGVVFLNEGFTASSVQPASLPVTVEEGALDLILEIRQDSGVMPNLHVELTGCGGLDPPASGGWQAYLVCAEPTPGSQTLLISVSSGGATGTGQALLRADLPS